MIYIFKTSIQTKQEIEVVTSKLNELLPDAKWNFDLEDCDNILRIDSNSDIREQLFESVAFDCIELI